MDWLPLLPDTDAPACRQKLVEIAGVLLESQETPGEKPGLLDGLAGRALFGFYYGRLTGDEIYFQYGYDALSDVFDAVNNGFDFFTMGGGLAGIGWTLEHLSQYGFLETSTNDVLEELDPYLHSVMMREIKKGNYDFLHGALGVGFYFLSRFPQAGEAVLPYLEQSASGLNDLALRGGDGTVKWESIKDFKTGGKGIGIALSHGMAAIVVFLSKLRRRGIALETVTPLLEGAVRYLLKQRLEGDSYFSCFPSWSMETDPPKSSRLAWCYGDLGISMALWQAAGAMKNAEWEKEALGVMEHAARRRDLKENSVVDAGLCHGTAGIAHIFHRMYRETGNDVFKETAIYWYGETLEMARFGDVNAGFRARYAEEHGGWVKKHDLLEGISGIGLALTGMVSQLEPAWDQCLLLS